MLVQNVMTKMIKESAGNLHDINHFMKVWAFARNIGILESLRPEDQELLEVTALMHDIACPLCRKKYGSAYGKKQELEGPALARAFLAPFQLEKGYIERVAFLIGHHHTYQNINSKEWQILVEADYLVNADEGGSSKKGITSFRNKVFKTKTGLDLLDEIYLRC